MKKWTWFSYLKAGFLMAVYRLVLGVVAGIIGVGLVIGVTSGSVTTTILSLGIALLLLPVILIIDGFMMKLIVEYVS